MTLTARFDNNSTKVATKNHKSSKGTIKKGSTNDHNSNMEVANNQKPSKRTRRDSVGSFERKK